MKTANCHASTCRNCRFFNPEGNRHGNCRQLHVTVDGDWQACSLGAPAFLSIAELLAQLTPERPAAKSRGYAIANE
jgi:hypothetical protein